MEAPVLAADVSRRRERDTASFDPVGALAFEDGAGSPRDHGIDVIDRDDVRRTKRFACTPLHGEAPLYRMDGGDLVTRVPEG